MVGFDDFFEYVLSGFVVLLCCGGFFGGVKCIGLCGFDVYVVDCVCDVYGDESYCEWGCGGDLRLVMCDEFL